jgi:nickel-dependent lactate racemase
MINSNIFEVPTLAWSGEKKLSLAFPEAWKVNFFPMAGYKEPLLGGSEVKNALRNPIGSKPVAKLAKGKREVVIVVDDMTRPTKARQILPILMKELEDAGIRDDRIQFIMGGGLHGAWYRHDFIKKIGEEAVEKYPIYNHNPFSNCEKLGETTRGTQVEINAEYNSCDLKIGIGSIVPHPQTGYGGGAKMILPGISSFETVYNNHAIVHKKNPPKDSYFGFLRNNITRTDIEEAGKIAKMDMKIDVLVNGTGDSAAIFAGDLQQEFIKAAEAARNHYSTPTLPKDVDILIANTYAKANEAVLALTNWKHVMNDNSVMILIAQAPEGQTTHYLYGKFGKKQVAPGGRQISKINFGKLIIFSEYKIKDPFLPIADSGMVWVKTWDEALEEAKNCFDYSPDAALIPNADIQCDEETLSRF